MNKGLSRNQATILRWLDEHPDSVGSVERLQSVVRANRQSVFRDLRSLEKRGLVKTVHFGRWVKAA